MPRVVIDFLPRNARRYGPGWAVVAVDVFRATTTACTAVASGRRCFPVASLSEAFARARDLEAVLAGEQSGCRIEGFDLGNSPADLIERTDIHRPLVLLTSSGTALLHAASDADVVFGACLRNTTAQARRLRIRDGDVAVVGAGTRDQVRMEDELACARVAVPSSILASPPTRRLSKRYGDGPGYRWRSARRGGRRPSSGRAARSATSTSCWTAWTTWTRYT